MKTYTFTGATPKDVADSIINTIIGECTSMNLTAYKSSDTKTIIRMEGISTDIIDVTYSSTVSIRFGATQLPTSPSIPLQYDGSNYIANIDLELTPISVASAAPSISSKPSWVFYRSAALSYCYSYCFYNSADKYLTTTYYGKISNTATCPAVKEQNKIAIMNITDQYGHPFEVEALCYGRHTAFKPSDKVKLNNSTYVLFDSKTLIKL